MATLPKGADPTVNRLRAARKAKPLRPLALKNTGAKAVASATAQSIKRMAGADVDAAHRGSLTHRDLSAAASRAEGFLPGSVHLAEALYVDKEYFWQGPLVRALCVAASGATQECPMSGALLIAVMDLVLHCLVRVFSVAFP